MTMMINMKHREEERQDKDRDKYIKDRDKCRKTGTKYKRHSHQPFGGISLAAAAECSQEESSNKHLTAQCKLSDMMRKMRIRWVGRWVGG